MDLKIAFGKALRSHRKAKGLSQESFSDVSSRTYLSTLERGIKSPTIEKMDKIAATVGIHPLTLLTECYLLKDEVELDEIFSRITNELTRQKGS